MNSPGEVRWSFNSRVCVTVRPRPRRRIAGDLHKKQETHASQASHKTALFFFVSNTDLKTHRHTPTELLWEKALDGIKLEVLFGSRGRKASAK